MYYAYSFQITNYGDTQLSFRFDKGEIQNNCKFSTILPEIDLDDDQQNNLIQAGET